MPVLILQVITYTVYEVYNYATGNYPHYLLYPVLPLLQATIHTICYTLYYHCYRQLSTLSAIPCTTTVTGNYPHYTICYTLYYHCYRQLSTLHYLLYPVLPLLQALSTLHYLLYPVLPLLQATIYTVYIYTITVRASTVNTGL